MPIRYVGRQPFFRGKTLHEIARNLKNLGVGRVVARSNLLRYPEKSFYRLTKVIPDMTDATLRQCTAWGLKTFRGEELGEFRIDSGHKADWILIPKDEEESFCTIDAKHEKKSDIPQFVQFPPLLKALVQQEMEAQGQDSSKPMKLPINIHKGVVSRIKQAEDKL
ncbi:28S ribosomal protein S34, mitochondrial-like [Gigantopelta aegis]|uniref:28S ribosomal protein S34, mitochondrial-like n=1 Tax=Gigantopelta aegis TaxID=1735272 RepID=UPI001B888AC5|nr:28S ribosomal protein S34, mitochondrial-like [Gigantopelta aegis]